ncbi:uncharacterized protein J3R85_020318 [Psidium guajava]|nr:uncharacterized protein J3R85_020318 [Psidium guajava]
MSLQRRQHHQPPPPPPPPPQPFMAYPNTFARPPPTQQHSHLSGSFGKVFFVLVIILAVSAIACCLGRICNRRSHDGDPLAKQRRGRRDVESCLGRRPQGAPGPGTADVGGSNPT